MQTITNKFLVFLIAILMIPCVSVNAAAEDFYDVNSALTYAAEHWNDETTGGPDQDLCAGFVSHCLTKGNIIFTPETDIIGNRPGEIPRAAWYEPFNAYYYWGCWGLFHDLAARSYTEVHTLNQDETGKIQWSQNIGNVSKGDVIFFHIKGSEPNDTDQYEHVVIVGNDPSDTYVNVYAHNVPRNNERVEIRPNREYICVHFTNAIQ